MQSSKQHLLHGFTLPKKFRFINQAIKRQRYSSNKEANRNRSRLVILKLLQHYIHSTPVTISVQANDTWIAKKVIIRLTWLNHVNCFWFGKFKSCDPALTFHLRACLQMKCHCSTIGNYETARVLRMNKCVGKIDGATTGAGHFRLVPKLTYRHTWFLYSSWVYNTTLITVCTYWCKILLTSV